MASQSDEIADEENGNNSDIDPIEVAIDAGASLSKPASASISRKRKIHVKTTLESKQLFDIWATFWYIVKQLFLNLLAQSIHA